MQNVPQDHPDKQRRDIWWVEQDGSNLDAIIKNGVRVLQSKSMDWLDKYADVNFALQYVRRKKEKETWQGGPLGFGPVDSVPRNRLIQLLEERQ